MSGWTFRDPDSLTFDEDVDEVTQTQMDQMGVELLVKKCMKEVNNLPSSKNYDGDPLKLLYVSSHRTFAAKALSTRELDSGFVGLDASRPWLLFWNLNTLTLFSGGEATNDPESRTAMDGLGESVIRRSIAFLKQCQDVDTGGFGGGPYQLSHLAPTYAAVASVALIGTKEAYDLIDRPKLLEFLQTCKSQFPGGGFALHRGGEEDVRGAYCAIAVAKLLDLESLTSHGGDTLFDGTAEWIASCQTYEGGLGGVPGMEAHGGYAYCGLAGLALLNRIEVLEPYRFIHWLSMRQMRFEGGFSGRSNKLVDSCYSFWVGACFTILRDYHPLFRNPEDVNVLCDANSLAWYVAGACQDRRGGIVDKPGKSRDHYHTCYALSGLSVLLGSREREKTFLENDPLTNVEHSLSRKMKLHFQAVDDHNEDESHFVDLS
eukprot:Clim_evm16s191 gene=Clim_evmTU16s191